MIHKVEQNVVAYFPYLPQRSGFSVHSDQNLTLVRCGLESSMFNVVFGRANTPDLDQTIRSVIQYFQGQSFAWWIPPSGELSLLSSKLLHYGLIQETETYAMFNDLTHFEGHHHQLPHLNIIQVSNLTYLEHFIQVLEKYDVTARSFYENIAPSMLQDQQRLFVGYVQGLPVVIGLLFIQDDTVGLYSLLTQKECRGQGYGTHMMACMMHIAQTSGVRYAVILASNDDKRGLYERLGFRVLDRFECFEYKTL